MKELINLMETCDYSEKTLNKFRELLQESFGEFPVMEMMFAEGRAVYRCRRHSLPFKPFSKETELSFRKDIENIHYFGRCNIPHSSIFYGSMVSGSIEHGYVTSIFETTGLHDISPETVDHEGYEMYSFGMWESLAEFPVVVIPPSQSNLKASELSKELVDQFNGLAKEFKLDQEMLRFYDLLGQEFSKDMINRPHNEYGLSAIFADHLFRSDPTLAGIAYPSVKAEQEGFNVVIRPDF